MRTLHFLHGLLLFLFLSGLVPLPSAASDIELTPESIRVTGIGRPPENTASPSIRREMAARAALSDGERKLVKAVAEIKVGADGTVGSRMNQGNFAQKVEGFIKGYSVIGEREMNDGTVEIDLELKLGCRRGLSRCLFE